MNKWSVLCASLLALSSLQGEDKLDHQIQKFFDTFNTKSNNTSSEYINSQLGVHFLGGSGVVRTTVEDVNPIHVQIPNFSAGCGGIDYTLGGINIAGKEEMKKALKSIASNGVSYAFLLGIETLSPVVASSMKQIQTWANQLNAININSCELASSAVQGLWPKTQRASSFICEHASTTNPLFSDLIEAKHGCRDRSKQTQAIDTVKKGNKEILVGSYNIAWKALENLQIDKESKNLFMTITGTIVVSDHPTQGKKVSVYPPNHKKAIEILRFGGEMTNAYQIDENGVDVKIALLKILPQNAWKEQIHRILTSLQEKILVESKDTSVSLSPEEENLISTTYFPIGSLLSVMAQYNGKGAMYSLDRYSDLIAFERVLKFAEEVVRSTIRQAEALKFAQVSGFELEEYIKQVRAVLGDLHTLERDNFEKISLEHQVIDNLIQFDKQIREKERGL